MFFRNLASLKLLAAPRMWAAAGRNILFRTGNGGEKCRQRFRHQGFLALALAYALSLAAALLLYRFFMR
jgi:hypothetical protein